MKIYKFLLEHFTDEQRFNITSKICLSILGRPVLFGVKCVLIMKCCVANGLADPEQMGPWSYRRLLFVLLTHQLYPCRPLAAYTGPPSSIRYTSPLGPDCFSEADLLCSLSACFADGVLPLDMEASELLSDTFEVLSSKEIKLLAMRSKPDKDFLMEEDDMALANVVMQEAQKKLISQVSV